MKRFLSLFLCVCMMLPLAACGESPQKNEPVVSVMEGEPTTEPAEETTPAYVYPEADLEGDTISVLNIDSYWGMHVAIDVEQIEGEILNDAIYNRNRAVEEKFSCVIHDDKYVSGSVLERTSQVALREIQSGDDTHDVMYVLDNYLVQFFTKNLLFDLSDLPKLHLDADWWDGAYNSVAQLGDSIFGAAGDLHLMGYDSSWCLFFNEDVLADNGVALPYDLVREGGWTLDKLHEYAETLANADTAGTDWTGGGSALYGIVTHAHAPDKFIFSMANDYVTKENDGSLTFGMETERFYNTVEKLADLLGTPDVTLQGSTDDLNPDKGYVYAFMNGYAAFLTAEVKTANNIREMEDTFGIVPLPKYDEAQQNYRTPLMNSLLVMTVPVTNTAPSVTAMIVDALAYESSQSVVPVYFDKTVAHKGLRNESSVEMLEIIRRSRSADIGVIYGWNSALAASVRKNIFSGSSGAASLAASYRKSIEAKIEDFAELVHD